jgi:hypothetical protein
VLRKRDVTAVRVETEEQRKLSLEVLKGVHVQEKAWAPSEVVLVPKSDLGAPSLSWFVACVRDKPVGVVRVLYELPLDLYEGYALEALDPDLAADHFLRSNRVAEVGRFAVLPAFRGELMVAAVLMRAAATETFARGYTHFVTDVFEDDPHSPMGFHTRVLGFEPVATHDHGELAAPGRRITMVLDLARAYRRLRLKRSWIYRFITEGWDEAMCPAVVTAD